MKYTKAILLSALCCALFTTQAHCAAEAKFSQKNSSEYFDVEAFVEQVENGELSDDQIRADLDRQNPEKKGWIRGKKDSRARYCTDTPAIKAASTNSTKALASFIRLGADLTKINERDFTALMSAAEEGHQEAVVLLMHAGVDVDFQGFEGCTALIRAAYYSQLAATQLLIEANADLDIQDNYKQTALIKSVLGDLRPRVEVVGALLNAKANTGIVDKYGKTAYAYTVGRSSHPKTYAAIAQMLVDAGAQPEAEMAAAQNPPNLWSEMQIGVAWIPVAAEKKPEEKDGDGGELERVDADAQADGEPVDLPASQNPELESDEAEIVDADAQLTWV